MKVSIEVLKSLDPDTDLVVLLEDTAEASKYCNADAESKYVQKSIENGKNLILLNQYHRFLFFIAPPSPEKKDFHQKEYYRKQGFQLSSFIKKEGIQNLQIYKAINSGIFTENFAEGLLLSLYQFSKYKTIKALNGERASPLQKLFIGGENTDKDAIREMEHRVAGTYLARDLVNEPVITLTAEKFSQTIREKGEDAGFSTEIWDKKAIEKHKMGGLLAVNAGSISPPTFNILTYKPENAVNQKPLVLVGKGVTYDTGGYSLKSTTGSMDMMKCDMAGGAAVTGAMYALAQSGLPLYVIGLIPATDNRPDNNAMAPGDVITMYDGTTVEIMNTDAEGRLIMADALAYARQYNPDLVIDLATLTGSAVAAIGKEGIVMMGNTKDNGFQKTLTEAGNKVYERLVEFPLWDEYKDYLKSDIADLKNVGGKTAGAITAGMFLKYFTSYDWIHMDIAGPAYLTVSDNYRGKNGTGVGVRLLYEFFKNLVLDYGRSVRK